MEGERDNMLYVVHKERHSDLQSYFFSCLQWNSPKNQAINEIRIQFVEVIIAASYALLSNFFWNKIFLPCNEWSSFFYVQTHQNDVTFFKINLLFNRCKNIMRTLVLKILYNYVNLLKLRLTLFKTRTNSRIFLSFKILAVVNAFR